MEELIKKYNKEIRLLRKERIFHKINLRFVPVNYISGQIKILNKVVFDLKKLKS